MSTRTATTLTPAPESLSTDSPTSEPESSTMEHETIDDSIRRFDNDLLEQLGMFDERLHDLGCRLDEPLTYEPYLLMAHRLKEHAEAIEHFVEDGFFDCRFVDDPDRAAEAMNSVASNAELLRKLCDSRRGTDCLLERLEEGYRRPGATPSDLRCTTEGESQ